MIHTPVCDLLGITHPIVLGGMATGTSVPLVAAVSNTGGLGILGVTGQSAAEIGEQIAAIRAATAKPFGVNFLLFLTNEANFAAAQLFFRRFLRNFYLLSIPETTMWQDVSGA